MTVKTFILYRTQTFNGRKVLTPSQRVCDFGCSHHLLRQSFTQTIYSKALIRSGTKHCTSAVVLPGTIFVGEAKTDNGNIMLKT